MNIVHAQIVKIGNSRGVHGRKEAAIGVFITLEEPSKDMTTESVSSAIITPTFGKKIIRAFKF